MTRSRAPRNAGFTLVESVISILIVAFAAVSLAQAYAYGQIFILKSGQRRMALQALHNEMESTKREADSLKALLHPYSLKPLDFDYNDRNLNGMLSSRVDPGIEPTGMHYQDIKLELAFGNTGEEDTVALSTRFYYEP